MFRPRVIPCLLLANGGLVKTRQFANPVYVGDPINAVRIFNDAEADELIFLDIQASRNGKTLDPAVVRNISDEAFMPFAVGGGLDSLDKIKAMFEAGAEKVVLNSAAHLNPKLITEAANIFGNQAVVVSIDARKQNDAYAVFTHGGTIPTEISLAESLRTFENAGAGEIFVNSIDRDGTREGYDTELIALTASFTSLPVIACGGAGALTDFPTASQSGASALAAGSLFVFVGRKNAVLINYPEKEELKGLFG